MSFYGNRQLGRYGSGMMGSWGAFGGGGRAIFGPFSFAESWSSDDFENATQFNTWVKPYLSQVNRTGLTWTPPSAALMSKASTVWASWQAAVDAGSADATAYMASITAQMSDLISRADALSLTGSNGHRSEADEVSRYDVFQQIKTVVTKVAASGAQAVNDANAAVAAGAASIPLPAGTISTGAAVYPSTTSGSGAMNQSQQGATGVAAPEDNTMLYLALAGGAIVVVGGVLYMRSRKKAVVAGYRRKSRKSRRSRR